MKIIGGQYKGRNFYMPAGIRPTQNLARKALFDILGQDMEGLSFLDLFAGSGGVGLEAISRGAREVVFVEKDPQCAEIVTDNVGLLRIDHQKVTVRIEVLAMDALAAIKEFARRKRVFDIVFVDPPYSRGLARKALKTLEAHVIVHPNSYLIFQHDQDEILPESSGRFLALRQKRYGRTYFSIYSINNKNII